MGHVERGVVLFAADQLDGIHQLLGIGIIKKEREALNGFVRQAAAAGFFPGEVLVKKIDCVAPAPELVSPHPDAPAPAAARSPAPTCLPLPPPPPPPAPAP